VAVAIPVRADWLKSVLFDRGYLARIKGDAIKVYLVMVQESGGEPDRSVSLSLSQLMERTRLSCPTVIDSLQRLERLGLVVSTTRERRRAKTYYVSDPPTEASPADES
jgi:replication initiation and membrane attachment protein DnaB